MMEIKNLKFSYMYRNGGNYKTYGEIVLANPHALSPEDATIELRKRLIDQEFFYPEDVGVPLVTDKDPNGFSSWYEFFEFSLVDDEDAYIAVENFLKRFNDN